MGCDIHIFTEVKHNNKWKRFDEDIFVSDYYKASPPFNYKSYRVFAFLADVRNSYNLNPISEPKGLPNDSEWLNSPHKYAYQNNPMSGKAIPIEKQETNKKYYEDDWNYHSHSWLTLEELLNFNYDSEFTCKGCYEGEIIKYKNFLYEGYFNQLEILKTIGKPEDVRIVFWFDN